MNEPLPSAINPPKPPAPKRTPPPTITTAAHQKTHTLIHPAPWLYLRLELYGPTTTADELDALTARTYLTSALSQFLGLTGAAIPVDILHLRGREVWVRVARGDGSAVVAAVSGWVGGGGGGGAGQGSAVGWRVRGRGAWLGGLVGGDGGDLFGE